MGGVFNWTAPRISRGGERLNSALGILWSLGSGPKAQAAVAEEGRQVYVIQYKSIELDPIDSGPMVFTPDPGMKGPSRGV